MLIGTVECIHLEDADPCTTVDDIDKVSVVILAETIVHHGAVVVKAHNALVAELTVRGHRRSDNQAASTESIHVDCWVNILSFYLFDRYFFFLLI